MHLKNIIIECDHVILEDVEGGQTALTPEDMLRLQAWCFDNNVALVAMCYRPQEPMFNHTQALRAQEEREQVL
jgi:hypothetical protein